MSVKKNKSETQTFIEDVGQIVRGLTDLGLEPVLVGGMALTLLGSDRVTQDFDFVVGALENRFKDLIAIFYDRGLELATRLDGQGKITATLDNRHVAAARLSLDRPVSVYFLNPKTGLRVDVLFDFPIPAQELAVNAKKLKVLSQVIPVASIKDLLRLKEIAVASRSKPGDAEDIEFLKKSIFPNV
jgi:hypothetical protein